MITLNLSPEVEDALKAQALAQGLTVEQWFLQLAEQSASGLPHMQRQSPDSWEEEFEQWLDSIPDTPLLSDEAISRASLYPDRW